MCVSSLSVTSPVSLKAILLLARVCDYSPFESLLCVWYFPATLAGRLHQRWSHTHPRYVIRGVVSEGARGAGRRGSRPWLTKHDACLGVCVCVSAEDREQGIYLSLPLSLSLCLFLCSSFLLALRGQILRFVFERQARCCFSRRSFFCFSSSPPSL